MLVAVYRRIALDTSAKTRQEYPISAARKITAKSSRPPRVRLGLLVFLVSLCVEFPVF